MNATAPKFQDPSSKFQPLTLRKARRAAASPDNQTIRQGDNEKLTLRKPRGAKPIHTILNEEQVDAVTWSRDTLRQVSKELAQHLHGPAYDCAACLREAIAQLEGALRHSQR